MTTTGRAGVMVMLNGALQRGVPLVVSFALSSTVGVRGFAEFTLFLAAANTIAALCSLGYVPFLLSSLSRSGADADSQYRVAAVSAIWLSAVALVVAGILLSTGFFPTQRLTVTLALLVLAPSLIACQAGQALYFAAGWFTRFTALNLTCITLLAAGLAGCIGSAHGEYTALIFSGYSCVFAALLLARPLLRTKAAAPLGQTGLAMHGLRFLRQSLPYFGYTGAWMSGIYACNWIVADRFGTGQLAAYNLGYQIFSTLLLVPSMLGGVVIPYIARAKHDGAGQVALRLSLSYGVLAIPVCAAILLAAPAILSLYHLEAAPESVATVRYLGLAGVIAAVATPLLQQFMAQGRFRTLYQISGLWLAVAVLGSVELAASAADVALYFLLGYACVGLYLLGAASLRRFQRDVNGTRCES